MLYRYRGVIFYLTRNSQFRRNLKERTFVLTPCNNEEKISWAYYLIYFSLTLSVFYKGVWKFFNSPAALSGHSQYGFFLAAEHRLSPQGMIDIQLKHPLVGSDWPHRIETQPVASMAINTKLICQFGRADPRKLNTAVGVERCSPYRFIRRSFG